MIEHRNLSRGQMLLLCTLLHFAVDGICGAAVAAYAIGEPHFENIVFYCGLYNLIAFGGQWFMGWVLDRNARWILPSFILVPVALGLGMLPAMGIFLQVMLLGVGNCVFHVAAGILILRQYETYGELGVFVSSGAVGLALGLHQFCGAGIFWLVCTAATAAVVYRIPEYLHAFITLEPESADAPSGTPWILWGGAMFMLGCVVLRGFNGGGSPIAGHVMLIPCVLAAGKTLGGICCDKIGYRKTILLIFILGFLALQGTGLWLTLLLALSCNMTMPLTLRLAHWCCPQHPGLMFGLAAGCLLPGAFYGSSFSVAPQCMVVAQFLILFWAGYIVRRFGNYRPARTGI